MKYSYLLVASFFSGVVASYLLGYTPVGIASIFLVASTVTFFAYAKDKRAARRGEWRVSERTLHLLSLLCGWPGAVVAQQRLRHKTKKLSFRLVFWATVAINVSLFAWLHFPAGSGHLNEVVRRIEGFAYSSVGSEPVRKSILFLAAYRRRP